MTVQVRDPVASAVGAVLDARLERHSQAPLAVALSGGSDSLALFHLVSGWARLSGRPVVALTVDHGLQPDSAAWAQRCAAMAADRGRPHRILRWEGQKPKTGIPAAARAARHALLAQAARELGARVLLMGHTGSDLAESAAMRGAGSTLPDAREWGPSPAWPEGRGVFVLRPLLGLKRGALQDWLAGRGITWIDDPANLDLRFARARARHTLASTANPKTSVIPEGAQRLSGTQEGQGAGLEAASNIEITHPLGPGSPRFSAPAGMTGRGWSSGVEAERWGYLVLPRDIGSRELAAACLCAAGTSTPPRTDSLTALLTRLATSEPFTATLAGARIEAAADHLHVFRETGELSRRPSPPTVLSRHTPVVFDGRFDLTATAPGVRVQPLWGYAAHLPKAQQTALKALPAAARGSLPLVTDGAGLWTCPILAASPIVRARSLVQARFEAALGFISREAEAYPVAEHGEAAGGVLS
ncbi:tRNA lysidine(34) synthetase TilS [Caulobacter sp. SLTY]|uniref:tRNA lysidine(34) synthetase TilS n=1 Tax=Caulobacter sp. SLTY TaxID=2683262 RepID=UPI001411CF6A|nr:tRNA lysidine(34) synthetase TilS [Caulobacter sp. SLTY]